MADRLFLRLDDDPLYAPETTVPAGTLREFAVPTALQDNVTHVMAYDELLPDGVEVSERVLPDGALRLIVDLQADGAALQVVGPSMQPVLLTMRGRLRGLSITLLRRVVCVVHEIGAEICSDSVGDTCRRRNN